MRCHAPCPAHGTDEHSIPCHCTPPPVSIGSASPRCIDACMATYFTFRASLPSRPSMCADHDRHALLCAQTVARRRVFAGPLRMGGGQATYTTLDEDAVQVRLRMIFLTELMGARAASQSTIGVFQHHTFARGLRRPANNTWGKPL